MFEIFFLVSGVSALVRRAQLGKLDRQRYGHVPPQSFDKWIGLNMNAQNMTLVSVGCYLGCAILIVLGGRAMDLGNAVIVLYILNLLFWAVFQATFHSRVRKLSKTLNIVWP